MTQHIDLLSFIADDPMMVSYRPRWNQMTGSVNATILLQQIVYRWINHGRRPFYKFMEPCADLACRPGDSWCEELGFSRNEFMTARKHIARSTKQTLAKDTFVSYWLDGRRKTWYVLNEQYLLAELQKLYPEKSQPTVGIQGELLSQLDNNLSTDSAFRNGQPDTESVPGSPEPDADSAYRVEKLNTDSAFSNGGLNTDSAYRNGELSTDSVFREGGYVRNPHLAKYGIRTFLTTKKTTKDDETAKDDFPLKKDKEEPHSQKQLWSAVLEDLRLQMTKGTFEALLLRSNFHVTDDGRALIVVDSDGAAEWINARLLAAIQLTLAQYANRPFSDLQAITAEELEQLLAFQAAAARASP